MIEYVVKKRKITLMFFIMVLVVGIFQFMGLPKQSMPVLTIKQASISTSYPGATPEKVEQHVTKVIEQKIKEMQGIKTISSTSSNGMSSIMVQLEDDENAKEKWDEMRRKIQDVEYSLPSDANQPIVNDQLVKSFIGSYAIYADSFDELNTLNDTMTNWEDQIKTVDGISAVTITGLPEQKVRVDLDTQKMQQYNISWTQVMSAIQSENERVPMGEISYNKRNYQLKIKDLEDIEQLNSIIITRTDGGYPIYLEHIGTATLTHEDANYLSYVNGKPAISMTIEGEPETDIPTVDKELNTMLDTLEESLPDGIHFKSLYTQNDRVSQIFSDLSRETLIAIIAVIIICTLGLNILTSGIVALAIPISIAMGLIFLTPMGITLNEISVIGLIIVLGILVDDAVVVNDNIERRLSVLKESPSVAAVKGTKEVSISIITATLATISGFAPLLFLSGDMGTFIKPIPTVITLTMLASMVMSLTIIPIFREWYEGKRGRGRGENTKPAGLLGKQIQTLTNYYSQKLMTKVVKRPLFIGLLGLGIGTVSYGLVPFVPVELFPSEEEPQFTVSVELPIGSSLEETNRTVQEIATWIRKQPNVESVSAAAGGNAPQIFASLGSAGSGDQVGSISVVGTEGKMDMEATVEEWTTTFKEMYPGITVTPEVPQAGVAVGKPVSIRITGQDLDKLRTLSEQVKTIIADTKGTYDIQDSVGSELYTLEFVVNKQAMDKNLVKYSDLSQTIRLISEGITVSELETENENVDITLYLNKENEDPIALFQKLSVTNSKGEQIPLSQVAEIKPAFSVPKISRYDLERTITVEADVRGTTATEAMMAIQQDLDKVNFPDGYKWEVGGELDKQTETFGNLGKLFLVAIFIIIVLITMQFYSITIPFIIITTVYLATAGAIIGLFITRAPIGFMTVMGIIALAGIVVRNGIVLIEFIEDARKEGIALNEAVIMATEARFRPILLTSLTAIVGLLPIAITGEVLFRPMAVTIISGLIFSTILTLFVVPSLYMVLAKVKERRIRRKLEKRGVELEM